MTPHSEGEYIVVKTIISTLSGCKLTAADLDQLNSDVGRLLLDRGMAMGGILRLCDEEEATSLFWPDQWADVARTLLLFGLGLGLLMTLVWLATWIVR